MTDESHRFETAEEEIDYLRHALRWARSRADHEKALREKAERKYDELAKLMGMEVHHEPHSPTCGVKVTASVMVSEQVMNWKVADRSELLRGIGDTLYVALLSKLARGESERDPNTRLLIRYAIPGQMRREFLEVLRGVGSEEGMHV